MFGNFLEKHFHSLYHRNYRYFFFGQMISLVGTWMQVMAQAWLVYTLTNSPFKLGIIGAAQFLPTLIFALFAGVLVDKYPKKNILIITQVICCLQAFTLFFLVHHGVVQYWHMLSLTLVLGCANAIEMPARESYIVELVGKGDVVNAVGLNSAMYNLARILGPAIAGVLMTSLGIQWCFLINAISFITVIFSFFMITVTGCGAACYNGEKFFNLKIFDNIKDGLLYIRRNNLLFKTSLIILFITIVGFNYNVLLPVFARDVLGLKEKGFGILLSSLGVGSLIGALMVSTMGKPNPKAKSLIISSMMLGLSLFMLGFTRNIYAASFVICLCGIFNLWFFTNANSILQLNSSDAFRGRVIGVYAMVFAGTIPIGNLISGFVAQRIKADRTFMYTGIIIMVVVLSKVLIIDSRKNNL